MDHSTWLAIWIALIVLLPVIPAVILFKHVPLSSADGEGKLAGMKWKLGGAFAGYAFVVLILVLVFKGDMQADTSAKVWQIRGRVQIAGDPNKIVSVALKTVPDNFKIDTNGSFVAFIAVNDLNNEHDFPMLLAQGSSADYDPRTILIRNAIGFTGAPRVSVDEGHRTVVIQDPIVLDRRASSPTPQ